MHIYKEETFGTIERLRELMKDRGYTQDRLAKEADIDVRSIRRWFAGSKIRKNNLSRVAEILDCDLAYLECTQDTPKKSKGTQIRLADLSIVDRYLPKIQELVKTTTQRFTYTIGTDGDTSDVIQGTFIDGAIRYYYEDLICNHDGAIYYEISVNGSDPVKRTPDEMADFVKGIMKYISFEVEQLKQK